MKLGNNFLQTFDFMEHLLLLKIFNVLARERKRRIKTRKATTSTTKMFARK